MSAKKSKFFMYKGATMEMKQLKIGAILSYLLVVMNSAYGLILTPFILGQIGPSEFGVYKTIGSITATIMVLDLGLAGTLQRYIAKFRLEEDQRKVENFYFIGIMQAILLSVIIGLVCLYLYSSIDTLYGSSFSASELTRSKQLFILLSLNVILHLFENVINGAISGYNQFIFSNGLKLISLIFRSILLFIYLPITNNAITIVIITLFLEIGVILAQLVYSHYKLDLRIKYHFWDKLLFLESFKYAMILFIQSIVSQVNSNLDNVVIGAIIGTNAVTIYSFGLLIFNMFQQLSTSLSGIILPTVMNFIHVGADNRLLEDFVVKVGRIQFLLMGAALSGFIILGQEFIILWLGDGFKDVWIITMILMFPSIWELSQNACLAILRAKNLLNFRTMVLVLTTFLNLFITIFGTRTFGYYAAAVGTAISITIGSLIIMNIYYYKVLKLNPIRIFRNIINKTMISLIISSLILIIANYYIFGNWLAFSLKVLIFCSSYSLLLLGFNKEYKFFNLRI